MYFEKDLTTEWTPQIRFPNGENVNLRTVSQAIQEQADESGIPVAFKEDQLKVGGLFSKEKQDVLIMYNPDHANDYLKFLVRLYHQGKYAFLQVYNMGGSKNYHDLNKAQGEGTMALLKSIGNAVKGTKSAVQAEENYYTILRDIVSNITGV